MYSISSFCPLLSFSIVCTYSCDKCCSQDWYVGANLVRVGKSDSKSCVKFAATTYASKPSYSAVSVSQSDWGFAHVPSDCAIAPVTQRLSFMRPCFGLSSIVPSNTASCRTLLCVISTVASTMPTPVVQWAKPLLIDHSACLTG